MDKGLFWVALAALVIVIGLAIGISLLATYPEFAAWLAIFILIMFVAMLILKKTYGSRRG